MNTQIVVTTRRRGTMFPAVLVLLSLAAYAPARAQIAVDELELRLSLRRGVALSENFHAVNSSAQPAQVTISGRYSSSHSGQIRTCMAY